MNIAIGLSALRASQFALDTVSQNIANANTSGYHRQRVQLAARMPQWIGGHYLGSGVDIKRVDRMRSQVLESSFTNSLSDLSGVQQGLVLLRQIESEFTLGPGSIHQSLTDFFGELNKLSANPNESVSRHAVVQQAIQLAQRTQSIHLRLSELKSHVHTQIQSEVKELNQQINALVELQFRIKEASVGGIMPNDLFDQRDELINRLAEKIDVQRFELMQDGFALSLAGSSISLAATAVKFETTLLDDGTISVHLAGSDRAIGFQSGSLAALIESHNTTIGQFQTRLNTFASRLMQQVDQAHAKGVGLDGPFTILRSGRKFAQADIPIQQASLPFPVTAGNLYFSITDPQGEKRTASIFIDPATDSIHDIANKINSVSNLASSVDTYNGQLTIFGQPGYKFDFTGNLETIPSLTSFLGSAVPRIAGQYTGELNRQIQVEIVGSGLVGRTPGLLARVTDSISGAVIAELNIGDGYEAGASLPVIDGVTLSFQAGTVNDGDSFLTHFVAESDATGILSALGLNSLFSGKDASDMRVATHIAENPRALAVSRSGEISDTANLLGLIRLRDQHLVGEHQLTFQDYLADITSQVGFQVRTQQRLQQNVAAVNQQYGADIAAISGVDLNEELINMVQFQKQFEAAIQVMRAFDNMLTELMSIVR
ncbi:MAG TPA: flagellar hook-associated protein FlgK [Pirellulaceae bacterium]|nr:flagellar hook-associated protein FlgK [Pirellulaceae bacterium]